MLPDGMQLSFQIVVANETTPGRADLQLEFESNCLTLLVREDELLLLESDELLKAGLTSKQRNPTGSLPKCSLQIDALSKRRA